ncbi:hypothetical protein DLM76_01735 [Leptospira yasudae]|nr:hypothetical protein DLM76_01735 [Leptospira yasudae]
MEKELHWKHSEIRPLLCMNERIPLRNRFKPTCTTNQRKIQNQVDLKSLPPSAYSSHAKKLNQR